MQFISINEAAQVSSKSIQTIRRMIKQKKIQIKREKTPQGFHYLILKDSLLGFINEHDQTITQKASSIQEGNRMHRSITPSNSEDLKKEFDRLNTTIQKLIEQNEHDKENFFQLIKTFQDRNLTLEEKIKLLEAPQLSWWQFWK